MGFLTAVQQQLFQNATEVIAKHPWLLGAGGGNTINFGKHELSIALNIVAILGGNFLLIPSIIHIVNALKGDNKDWTKAGINFITGVIGLLIAGWGASGITGLFTKTSSDFDVNA